MKEVLAQVLFRQVARVIPPVFRRLEVALLLLLHTVENYSDECIVWYLPQTYRQLSEYLMARRE